MTTRDMLGLGGRSLRSHPARSALTALGIAIGIAAVVLLTSIGSGVRRFVLESFSQFGTRIIAINPGRAKTHGGSLGVFGSARPLSIDDAEALRRIRGVRGVVPAVQGNAEIESDRRQRRATVLGVGPDMPAVFEFGVAAGRFLPPEEPTRARAFAVLGAKLRRELFGARNPLGRRVRIGGRRFRIVGVMEPKGTMLGLDLNDAVYVPAARALELFDRPGLMEIDVSYGPETSERELVPAIRRALVRRHGKEDFTITGQEQMLDVLDRVLRILTFAVGALGGISLLVGAVGVLTIMTIAVRERRAEIGVLRALGAERRQILALFLGEAIALAAAGGLAGLALGVGGGALLRTFFPRLPLRTAWSFVGAAELLAVAVGLAAGALPARRAAGLDPVEALRAE